MNQKQRRILQKIMKKFSALLKSPRISALKKFRVFPRKVPRVSALLAVTGIIILTILLITKYHSKKTPSLVLKPAPATSPYLYQSINQDYKVYLGSRSSKQTPQVKFAVDNSSIDFRPEGSISDQAKLDKQDQKSLVYKNVYPDVDLRYSLTDKGVKEEIILQRSSALDSASFHDGFTFKLNLKNAVPQKDLMGNLTSTFVDPISGNYLFHFEKPFMIDAAGNRSEQVQLLIRSSASISSNSHPLAYTVTVAPDQSWLASALYPVIIDPSIVHDTQSEFSTGTFNRAKDVGAGATAPSIELTEQELPTDINTVGLWHMNESSGTTTVADSSGNSNTGTSSSSTNVTTGKFSNARSFNGTSDYIQTANTFSINTATSGYTISAWIYQTSTNGYSWNSIAGVGIDGVSLGINTGSGTIIGAWACGNQGAAITVGNFLNAWHHIAVVYTQNASGFTPAQMYFDGNYVGNSVTDRTTSCSATSTFQIGKTYSGYNTWFSGYIDEVKFSNVARTPEEIKLDAQKRPYGVYTSSSLDLGTSVQSLDSLQWAESITGPTAPSGWTKVKPVIIDNSQNTNALTNYQIKLTIPYDSAMQSDFDDLRFYTSTGTSLDYWIESKSDGVEATVWVEVDSIPASSKKTIFMFYGNSGASTGGNIGNTMEFGDDFDDTTIDTTKWPTGTRDTTGFSESGGYLNGSNTTGYLTSNVSFTGNYIQETLHRRTTDATNGYQSGGFYTSTSNAYGVLIHPTNGWYIRSDSAWNGPYATYTSTGWVRTKIVAIGSGSYVQHTGAIQTSQAISNGGLSSEYIRLGRRYDGDSYLGQTYSANWDWIFVRKYTSPEPVVGLGADIEFQTRTSANNSTWEEWKPTGVGSTAMDSMDGPYQYNITDSGLVSYWPMDETVNNSCTGGVNDICDKKGSDDGAATGTTIIDGKFSKGRGFNGSNDYINTTLNGFPASTNTVTIEFWAYNTSAASTSVLQATTDDGANRINIHFPWADGNIYWDFGNAGGTGRLYTAFNSSWYNIWAHWTFISESGVGQKIYRNGVLIASDGDTSTFTKGSKTLDIGRHVGTNYWNGQIDELRIYSTALSASTVLQHYQEGSTRPDTLSPSTETTIKMEGSGSMKTIVGAPLADVNTKGLWHLDETGVGTGSTAYDSSGNNNHGIATGTTLAEGFYGKARSFNGSSDHIIVDNSQFIHRTNNFTYSWWVKWNATPTSYQSYFENGTWVNSLIIRQENANNINIYAMSTLYGAFSFTPSVGSWYHLAVVRNGNTLYLYVNGAQTGSMSFTADVNPSANLWIGASQHSPTQTINATMDEIQISNIARSAEEIAEAYRAGRNHRIEKTLSSTDLSSKNKIPFYIASDRVGTYLETYVGETSNSVYGSDASTVGLWHLDEQSGSGAYIKDSSGNSNHGTPYKFKTFGTGMDGSCTVSSGSINLNTQSCAGRTTADAVNFNANAASAGQNQITLTSTPTGLVVNDEVLIIDLQGGSSIGLYETKIITAISVNTLTLNSNLTNSYDGGATMVQRIPNYTNVTVNTSTTLTANIWDGSKSGVLFFRANGTVTVTGTINMNGVNGSGASPGSGIGFNGGSGVAPNDQTGYQGTSYNGSGSQSTAANNGGGGGGSRHLSGVYNPDGGGGGGYGSAGSAAVPKTNPCNCTAGGSTYGTADLSSLYLGSGGGGGGSKWSASGGGGGGGGIIYIAGTTINVTGAIQSIGGNGGAPGGSGDGDGDGGGGGSGGSIVIKGSSLSLGSSLVAASGGTGNTAGSHSNGGNGGVGRIAVYYISSWSTSTNPAAYTSQFTDTSSTTFSFTQGKIGGARYFNGSSDYIDIGNSTTFDVTNYTIEAWVYSTNYSQNGFIFEKGPVNTQYSLFFEGGSVVQRSYNSAGTLFINQYTTLANAGISNNNWYHIVSTYDGSAIKLYVNGQLKSNVLVSGTLRIGQSGERIGAYGGTPSYFFNGTIDEVRISNTARTADEIRQNYQYGLRTHQITIDYSTGIGSSAPTSTSDVDFNPTTTTNLYVSDTVIVREKVGATTYIMQGEVTSISSGVVTVSSWSGTAPPSGYTTNANVFKWQREYWDITDISTGDRDAITKLGIRVLDATKGFDAYFDDFRSNQNYLTTPAGSSITSTAQRYFQYRSILTTNDTLVSPSLTSVTLNYTTNNAPSAPTSLLAEGQTNPTAIHDTTPEFSAIYNDTDVGDTANAYQIQVDDDSGFGSTIWDSGASGTAMTNCIAGNRCQDISYAGSSLTRGTTYYWRIKYWDDEPAEGAWSTGTNTFSVNQIPTAPTSLLTESQTNPTGVTDTTPEFSAIYNDLDVGDTANAYRIQVDDDSGFGSALWDSGASGTAMTNCIQGNRCSDISYGGTSTDLQWNTKYYWRIKFWDDGGLEGAWSTESAYFTMSPIYEPTACMIDDSGQPSQLIVKWNDNTTLETGYRIERSVDGGAFSLLTTEAVNSTSSTDNTTSSNHTYRYQIRANSNNSNSQWCGTETINYNRGNLQMQGVLVR